MWLSWLLMLLLLLLWVTTLLESNHNYHLIVNHQNYVRRKRLQSSLVVFKKEKSYIIAWKCRLMIQLLMGLEICLQKREEKELVLQLSLKIKFAFGATGTCQSFLLRSLSLFCGVQFFNPFVRMYIWIPVAFIVIWCFEYLFGICMPAFVNVLDLILSMAGWFMIQLGWLAY